MKRTVLRFALLFAVFCASATTACSEVLQFGSQRHCESSSRLTPAICANAAANAAAEFEEKAPRFPTRDACERVFRGGCAVGFRGASGYAGRRDALFFSPRQQGFRVILRSSDDIRVSPTGPDLGFATRTAMTRDASIHPRGSRDYHAPSAAIGAASAATFGVATPDGAKGPLPPRPPVDPNFDCAAVLEPGADATTGCVLAPLRRR